MKKKNLLNRLATVAIAVVVAVSCQSREEYFDRETTPGEVVAIQLSPVLPGDGIKLLSSDGGGAATLESDEYALRYILEVWSDDGTRRITRKVQVVDNYATTVDFSVSLVANPYQFVFWADFVDKEDAEDAGDAPDTPEGRLDLTYTTNSADGLKDIEWTAAAYEIGSDLRDAYYARETIDLSHGNASNQNVTLRRPFGKLRILATDVFGALSGNGGDIVGPLKAELTYSAPATFRNSFNAVSGLPNDGTISTAAATWTPINEESVTVLEQPYTNVYLLAFDYFLVPDGLTSVSFEIKLFDVSDALLGRRTVTDAPIGINKLTTVIGDILTDASNLSVSIGDGFGGGNADVAEAAAVPIPSGLKCAFDVELNSNGVQQTWKATLSWKGDASVDEYEVALTDGTPYAGITAMTKELPGMEEKAGFGYKVRAKKGDKYSEWSATRSFTTPPIVDGRYRGIGMYDDEVILEADIDRLGDWGVNLTRFMFAWSADASDLTGTPYRDTVVRKCDRLAGALPALKRNGIKVCIVLETSPGGKQAGGANAMFRQTTTDLQTETNLQTEFVETWKYISSRFKDEETVVMYDLMNEPYQGQMAPYPHLKNVDALFLETAQAIRAQGDNTAIVYEPYTTYVGTGSTETGHNSYDGLTPFAVTNIIYSDHVYRPHELTHQALGHGLTPTVSYPGVIDTKTWNKEAIRTAYADLKTFADNNDARVFIGEFGCVNYAPNGSAFNYINDCLEIFDEEGWDYAYFGYNPMCSTNYGATAWSAQHGTLHYDGPCPLDDVTDRLQLLQDYWKKNEK